MKSNDFYCMHSDMCKTLANEKRQMIIDTLRDSEMTVTQLIGATGITQANLSQHLAILRAKGVVRTRREGTRVFYAIANPKILAAFDLISEAMAEAFGEQKETVDTAMADSKLG
jgi:DNA-binding transcriptional ArsR family regulator